MVGDVAQLNSETIVRLQQIPEPLRAAGASFLFPAHGNVARAKARFLDPIDILPALSALEPLLARIDWLQDVGGSTVAAWMPGNARGGCLHVVRRIRN
ncbi:hypothetical protein ACQKQD_32875 [Methylobacterium sp. NPDC080182]|uniref:hypothetical protein n=1 Tax=Methylobacterium sp. NPDC080182 TaxID=3390590 RepID=UPI003D039AD4